jgi:hypothetical protein
MRMKHKIEVKVLALRLRASVAKKLKIQTFFTSTSHPFMAWFHINSFLQTFQKDGSRDNLWGCWVIELGKNFFNLPTYDGTTTNKKLSILASKTMDQILGWEIQEMRMVPLELTTKGLRGQGCPWATTDASLLPLILLQSLIQSLPTLAFRVLACS